MAAAIWVGADAGIITAGVAAAIVVGADPGQFGITQTTDTQGKVMKSILLSVLGVATLLSTAAIAAPFNPATSVTQDTSAVEQVRLVCDQYGRCYRTRGHRYVQRGYGDGYARQDYGNYGGGQRYYGGGQGYYGGGPSIGLSFGNRGW